MMNTEKLGIKYSKYLGKNSQNDNGLSLEIEEKSVASNDKDGKLTFKLLVKYNEVAMGNKYFQVSGCKKISESIIYKEAMLFSSSKSSKLVKKVEQILSKNRNVQNENTLSKEVENEIKEFLKGFLKENALIYSFYKDGKKISKVKNNFDWLQFFGVTFQLSTKSEQMDNSKIEKRKLGRNGLLSLTDDDKMIKKDSFLVESISFGSGVNLSEELEEKDFDNIKISLAESRTSVAAGEKNKGLLISNVPVTIGVRGFVVVHSASIVITTSIKQV